MIVVDANIIVYWATNAPQTAMVAQLQQRDPDWRAPSLWRYEFSNVMATMARARMLSETDALDAINRADLLITPREQNVSQADALRIALLYSISTYDAQYVTLAQALGVPCITCDAPLARKAPGIAILLSDFLRHP